MAAADVSKLLSELDHPQGYPVITQIEGVFDSMGLMTGTMAPVWRASLGFALGTGLVYAVRPGFMFHENGSPRPWKYVSNQPGVSTSIPWWLPGSLLAIAFGVFV